MGKAALLFKDNIRVHFSACETLNQFEALKAMGVGYTLYTAYPFVERMIFDKFKSPVMTCYDWQNANPFLTPAYIIENSRRCIQDSGLFTLMFGSRKGNRDESLMNKWYDALVKFTLEYGRGATCVEVDCQKVLGVEKAWEFRQRMKKDLPNRQINVFHIEDGQRGLDRLIEFSGYIAISVPELRIAKSKTYREDTHRLACYIKNKKPGIDIHLLGCTESKMLQQNRFCTSCDSSSYLASKRYGYLKKNYIKNIFPDKVRALVGDEIFNHVLKFNSEKNTGMILLTVYDLLNRFRKYAGTQN